MLWIGADDRQHVGGDRSQSGPRVDPIFGGERWTNLFGGGAHLTDSSCCRRGFEADVLHGAATDGAAAAGNDVAAWAVRNVAKGRGWIRHQLSTRGLNDASQRSARYLSRPCSGCEYHAASAESFSRLRQHDTGV